ncbi:hypothetical protein [Acinetobacter terrestris]|jgi:hypothetical protein|uniref:Apea-like HEPN domain-containing protein n=2 Tax=Acinetobacter terrestris TaxID=2529843 RepID=A0AAW6UUY4_9GAMM|nr:hypothetical protein [Acinetobacter terrestris]MDK1684012.1 hypothetical protein [Acinetobacter terrestris]
MTEIKQSNWQRDDWSRGFLRMILDTRKKLIEDWKSDEINHIEESIWSSTIQQKDLNRIREFLSKNNFKYVDISIVRPPDDTSERMKFRTYYDEIGQCFSTNYNISIPANSNNLKLTVGIEDKIANQECQNKTLHIINSLRIIFGVPIARELMFTALASTEKCIEVSMSSELGYASKFDVQSLNLYQDIEYSELRELPIDALTLLDKAFQQKFAQERFILMWVAFEAIINSLPIPGGNGDKRKKYFLEELSSAVANEEVRRLHSFRNDVFKEARFIEEEVEEINWSLYMAIQLAMLSDCPQRQAFLNGYEQYIQQKL